MYVRLLIYVRQCVLVRLCHTSVSRVLQIFCLLFGFDQKRAKDTSGEAEQARQRELYERACVYVLQIYIMHVAHTHTYTMSHSNNANQGICACGSRTAYNYTHIKSSLTIVTMYIVRMQRNIRILRVMLEIPREVSMWFMWTAMINALSKRFQLLLITFTTSMCRAVHCQRVWTAVRLRYVASL